MASIFDMKPLIVPKAADVLADRLRERILAGGLLEGSRLPTERELCESSGLSRGSVREALRILESEGLIQTRPGRNGGTLVRQPTVDSIARSIRLFLRGHALPLKSLIESREVVEPAIARLAALNRTPDDLVKLVEAQQRLSNSQGNSGVYLDANVDWHLAVVTASHNEPLIGFMTALSDLIHTSTELVLFDTDDVRRATIYAHERIQAAIVAGDADAAERRMLRHVCAFSSFLRKAIPDQAGTATIP